MTGQSENLERLKIVSRNGQMCSQTLVNPFFLIYPLVHALERDVGREMARSREGLGIRV
jgi:hypothetical protein